MCAFHVVWIIIEGWSEEGGLEWRGEGSDGGGEDSGRGFEGKGRESGTET